MGTCLDKLKHKIHHRNHEVDKQWPVISYVDLLWCIFKCFLNTVLAMIIKKINAVMLLQQSRLNDIVF